MKLIARLLTTFGPLNEVNAAVHDERVQLTPRKGTSSTAMFPDMVNIGRPGCDRRVTGRIAWQCGL
jgi:hypothetical protein